jgi:F0F1-type ATP synthase membrane subunit c/vacuolar-type H+-ATPase subunit K
MERSEVKSKQFKLWAAGVGAGAAVLMGVLGAALSQGPTGVGTVSVVSDEMTLGETITETTAPPEPETTVVEPAVTAEPPDGFGPDWAG